MLDMLLMEALEIVDPETSTDAMKKYAGDCQLANIAMTEARRVVCAAVRDLQTVKVERDAAVRDVENIMRWDNTSVFCQFCKKDEVCDLNHTDCAPEWRGQQKEDKK